MLPLLTREAVRAVDRHAIEELGVPGLVLMENAGAGATAVLCAEFAGQLSRPLILGGPGQNGGDAWVVARHLLLRGITPRSVLIGELDKVRGDARVNFDALCALGASPVPLALHEVEALSSYLADATVVVDGLFGTGLDRAIEGSYALAVGLVNSARVPVFALDLPSGIDANTGSVLGVAVRAQVTATFCAHKRGLHQYPGAEHAGVVRLVSIGVPAPEAHAAGLIEASDVARAVPPRAGDAHKGTNGHVVAFAGSPGKTGAAVLCATSALRNGAGLVTIATSPEARAALDHKVVEIMTAPIAGPDLLSSALALARDKDGALLGPGFGLDPRARALARSLALDLTIPTVLDADALTAFAGELALLRGAKAARVLTPHPGEAARLLNRSVADVQRDRYAAALSLADQSDQVVVLKGARTLIAAPSGELRVCTAGTPALGTAGTGDVLAGAIAALLPSLTPFAAAWVSVELHARAGEIVAASDRGILAGEVAAALPHALERCRAVA
jgi:NAD(P)H-hydrate epimerase